jgi:hypothetical protein
MRSAQEVMGENAADDVRATPDNRKFPRFHLDAPAMFLFAPNENECVIEDASATGVSLAAKTRPPIGETVIIYSDLLGRLECRIVRHHERGFAAEIETTANKREKLAELLKWVATQISAGRNFHRAHERVVPSRARTILRLRDGTIEQCMLKDLSRAGAAIVSSHSPDVNTLVTIGSQRARVVRRTLDGFAVEFLRLIPIEVFDENFVL